MPVIYNPFPDVRKYRDQHTGTDVLLQPGERRSVESVPPGCGLPVEIEQTQKPKKKPTGDDK